MTYRNSKSMLFCHKNCRMELCTKRADDTCFAKKLTPGILAEHAFRHNTEIGIKDTAAESEAPPPNHE